MSIPSEFAYPRFQPTRRLVKVIVILLVVDLAFNVPYYVVEIMRNTQSNGSVLGGLSFALLAGAGASGLSSGILTLIWVNKANKNLVSLGATELRFTPDWAVIWFFIPIANIWKPYYVVEEIWKASDPSVGKTDSRVRNQMSRPKIVLRWWVAGLALIGISFAVTIVAAILSGSATNVAPETASIIMQVVYVWLTIRVIEEIDIMQAEKIRAMRSGSSSS